MQSSANSSFSWGEDSIHCISESPFEECVKFGVFSLAFKSLLLKWHCLCQKAHYLPACHMLYHLFCEYCVCWLVCF